MTTVTKFKGSFAGVLCNSMLFSFIHFRNYGITAIALFNLFLLGIIFSILFNMTKNILFVTGVHTTWNFTMGCVLGNKVSGGILLFLFLELLKILALLFGMVGILVLKGEYYVL